VIDTQGNAKNGDTDTVYEFDVFHDVQKALEVLLTLHNDSFVDNWNQNTNKNKINETPSAGKLQSSSSSSSSSSKPSPSTTTSLRTNVSRHPRVAGGDPAGVVALLLLRLRLLLRYNEDPRYLPI